MNLVTASELVKLLLPDSNAYIVYMHEAPTQRCRVVQRTNAHFGDATVTVLGQGNTYEEAIEDARRRHEKR